jgi:SAM-dependent methyltransferase
VDGELEHEGGEDEWFRSWFDRDYAAVYQHRDGAEAEAAVTMALARAPGLASGPVLDLGCGSGRHLAVLRRTNPLAFGLDLSRDLLALAPEELRPWLLRGDMRRLPVKPERLAGVCLWFTPFGYFSDRQNGALLRSLAGLLRPGGVLVLDYLNADHVRRHLVPADTVVRGRMQVASRRTLEGDRLVKRMTLTHLDTGRVRHARESLRLYQPEELRALSRACGLEPAWEAGDYQGAPFDPASSQRWIGFLIRPAAGAGLPGGEGRFR